MKHSLNLRFTMSTLQEVEKLIAKMTRAEKAQFFQWVVHDRGDTFPGIDAITGVCGGESSPFGPLRHLSTLYAASCLSSRSFRHSKRIAPSSR
jgi:hypothetical protein